MTYLEWNIMLNYHVHTCCKFLCLKICSIAPPFEINLIYLLAVHIVPSYNLGCLFIPTRCDRILWATEPAIRIFRF